MSIITSRHSVPKIRKVDFTGRVEFSAYMSAFGAYHYNFSDCEMYENWWDIPEEAFIVGHMEVDYDTMIPEQRIEFHGIYDWIRSKSIRAKYMLMMSVLENLQWHGECWA